MKKVEKFIKNIKTNGIIRRLDELGRIVIPIETRKKQNIQEGETKVKIHNIEAYVIIEIVKDDESEIYKKFDLLGRVVVNKEIRDNLNWEEKDKIEIWDYDNYIILKKVESKCIFCGKQEELISYKEKLICNNCIKHLANV